MLAGGDCHTHQALNVQLVEEYTKLGFFCSENFGHLLITQCSREETYQALPAFLYCKATKSWVGPGNKARLLLHVGKHNYTPSTIT